MSKPLFRSYDTSNRPKKKPNNYKETRTKYKDSHFKFVDNDKPTNALILTPVSKSHKRHESQQKKKFANSMKNKSVRIARCIERREQNKIENRELLTTRQTEVKAELARRGLLDENGKTNLSNLDVNTGYNKNYTYIVPDKAIISPFTPTAQVELRGTYLNRFNMQIAKEKEIAKTIKEEGQAVMRKDSMLEHTPWDFYHTYVKHYERPREDFVYHKPIPPEQAITIRPELKGVKYRGKKPISFGNYIRWNRQNTFVEFRKYVFYQECKLNPSIIWLDLQ